MRFWHCIAVVTFFLSKVQGLLISRNLTRVYGPGLRPDKIVLPVRYFDIEAINEEGNRINKSLGKAFDVQIEGESGSGTYCRVWTQVLDRYDGSYIVRYRTYQTCRKATIYVLYKNEHVGNSPYKLEEPIYSENCYCPFGNIDQWQEMAGCHDNYPQIEEDLAPFKNIDMDIILNEVQSRFNHPGSQSLCNYVVKNNEVYRKCYGKHVGFNMFMDNILHSMARKMIIPDLEFIFNLGDWPLVNPKMKPLLPIFSWCGSEETKDIVLPTYDLTEATLEMMGRVMLDMLSVQSNNDVPWGKKKSKAFWRGRDSRQERLDLIALARQNPKLFNASLTNFFFFRDKESEYGPKSKHESFFKFFDYKYQINIDGTVASYRLPYLLAGSGVVFKQDSPYYEHFYRDLIPYKHYIPFKRDLSDLVEKIQWAKKNDDEVHNIGLAGRQFAQENLMPEDIFCYHARLFTEWKKLVISPVKVREGMEHIENKQEQKRFGDCDCHRLNKHDEL